MDVTSTVTFEDKGLQALFDKLAELKALRVRIGYSDAEGRERYPGTTVSVALVAAINEFGWAARKIPERSFARSTLVEQRGAIKAMVEANSIKVCNGDMTPVEAMSQVGEFLCAKIREKLLSASGWAAPLDPDTVRQKGGNATPLSDTGLLAKNLGWKVAKGREVLARGK
jgi:hypothetical protein